MPINVIIKSPDAKYFKTLASIVNVDTIDGKRGILPGHVALCLVLKIGMVEIEDLNHKRLKFSNDEGLLYIENNEMKILVNSFEAIDQIDLNRALKAKERALSRIDDLKFDQKRVKLALNRAINRIKVKNGE